MGRRRMFAFHEALSFSSNQVCLLLKLVCNHGLWWMDELFFAFFFYLCEAKFPACSGTCSVSCEVIQDQIRLEIWDLSCEKWLFLCRITNKAVWCNISPNRILSYVICHQFDCLFISFVAYRHTVFIPGGSIQFIN